MAACHKEYSRSLSQYVEGEWPNLSGNTWLCSSRIGTETHAR